MYLTLVDTAQIQPYVFGSNRLRENIGASYLVAMSTGDWAFEAVSQITNKHNVQSDNTLDKAKCIDSNGLDAEVIQSGGGNFVVVFNSEELAKAFTRKLSQRVLTDAPGLQLVITTLPFEWRGLAQAIKDAFASMASQKRARVTSTPLLGLGVTVMCQSTGLPATEIEKPVANDESLYYPASDEIIAKTKAFDKANRRLLDTLNKNGSVFSNYLYKFPYNLDDLGGTKGEHSFIAVVHADGNGMGQRFIVLSDGYQDNPRGYISAIRDLSEAVENNACKALQATLRKLVERIQNYSIKHPCAKLEDIEVKLARNRGTGDVYLPFRPIVFGGDDVTFVCDGRLGLSLALYYLEQFERQMQALPDKNGGATACAGVAIVKTHYPFARAYDLSEQLLRSAKHKRHKESSNASWIDWHYALSGLSGEIEEIRRREYEVFSGKLYLRPVSLTGHEPHSWNVIEQGLTAFQESDQWRERRNKVKVLRESLREGENAVKYFIQKFNDGNNLPEVYASFSHWESAGWQNGLCGYFDAIELVDSYMPIEQGGSSP